MTTPALSAAPASWGEAAARARPDRLGHWGGMALALACFGVALLVTAFLLPVREFNPDEFEHLHAAYCYSLGQVPYRDFFEHHNPLLYLVLRAGFDLPAAGQSPEAAVRVLEQARWLCFGFSLAGVAWLAWLAWKLGGGLLAAGTLGWMAGVAMWWRKLIEVRPDTLALPLLLAGLWCLWRGAETAGDPAAKPGRRLLAGGLLIGMAMMATQKVLFVLPGLVVWLWWCGGADQRGWRCWRGTACFAAGCALPMLAVAGLFAAHGAAWDWFEKNYLLNARWQFRASPFAFMELLVEENWIFTVFVLGGLFFAVRHCWRRAEGWRGWALVLCALGSLLAGLFIIPVAGEQYYVMVIPLAGLCAALALAQWMVRLPRWLAAGATGALMLGHLLPSLPEAALPRDWPAQPFFANADQMEKVRAVMLRVPINEPVLDAWSGLGVFRPHAFYYYFVHREIRPLVPEPQRQELLERFRCGHNLPRAVILDPPMENFLPELRELLPRHYTPGPHREIWFRKEGPA